MVEREAFVLDNSVSMRWFFDSDNHLYADLLLRDLTAGTREAVVPALWRYEVSSVLARAQIRDSIPARAVEDFLTDLKALPIRVDDDGGKFVLTDVHRLAVKYRLTTYDACYLELSMRLSLPLATLDRELKGACDQAGVNVL